MITHYLYRDAKCTKKIGRVRQQSDKGKFTPVLFTRVRNKMADKSFSKMINNVADSLGYDVYSVEFVYE